MCSKGRGIISLNVVLGKDFPFGQATRRYLDFHDLCQDENESFFYIVTDLPTSDCLKKLTVSSLRL